MSSTSSPLSSLLPQPATANERISPTDLVSMMYTASVLGNPKMITALINKGAESTGTQSSPDKPHLEQAVKTAEKITKMGKIADILKILGAIFLSIGIALAIGATVSLFLMPAIAVPLALAAASTAAVGLSLLIGQNVLQSNIQEEALKLTRSLIA